MRLSDIKVWVSASQLHKVMTGEFGLSKTQEEKLRGYQERHNDTTQKPLTDIMIADMYALLEKRDNPTIGLTAESYIRELIVENLYEMPKEISSKYLSHGNFHEPYSIGVLGEILGIPLVKCEERKSDEKLMLTGMADIHLPNQCIIDIKNPWDPFTFSSNMTEDIDGQYWWQLQAYMQLYNVETSYLVYTLNEHMYLEDPNAYDKFTWLDRIIIKQVDRDPIAMESYKARIPAIMKLIDAEKLKMQVSIMSTKGHIINMRKSLAQNNSNSNSN